MVRWISAVVGLCAVLGNVGAASAAGRVVLFDQGHGQRFLIEQEEELGLSRLAQLFRDADSEVRSASGSIGSDALAGVDVLVTSGLFVPYSQPELQAILAFVEAGGSLAVMLHVAPTYANLLGALGVLSSPGVLNESQHIIDGNPLNYQVVSFLQHPLVAGLERFDLYGGWAVMNAGPGAETIAFTSRQSWIDADRDRQRGQMEPLHSYGVLVAGARGQGRFAVFGDDAIFQNRFLGEDNRKLAVNLIRWLTPGR